MAVSLAQPDVRQLERELEVRWLDGSVNLLPYLWLRDNCGCEQCRVVQTGEKRFLLSSVPADLRPDRISLDGDNLCLTWPNGHETRYRGSDVRGLETGRAPAWTPWNAAFTPRRAEFRRFLRDDATAAAVLESFLEFGAVVLVDAPTAPGTLEALAPRLGPLREVLFARIHDVKVDPSGYNIAHTAIELPPHNDFASYSWPPSVQALHMLVNETPGGASVIVDGWRVLRELRDHQPGYFDVLCRTPVPFREFDDTTETFATEPIIRLDARGEIAGLRFSNQLMQTLPPGPDLGEFYRAYHDLCCRITNPAGKSSFRLEGGHILIVAGHRVLHAREAFEATGRRHLQDGYFEHDNLRNHLVVLKRTSASWNDLPETAA